MTVLDKLRAIEQAKVIYNIHYCKAGVGFVFYDREREAGEGIYAGLVSGLVTDRYYLTFEEAVEGEYLRLNAS